MDWLNHFHFVRPLWFLSLLPLLWLAYRMWTRATHNTGLENAIAPSLLQHLTLEKHNKAPRAPLIGLFVLWAAAVIALAGPTWKQIPQPLSTSESAVVILLDLSPSMRAEDTKPSRIIRAHLKIQDFLSQRKDGLTALIVYAGEAHVVTPLTDDTKTIANLLATLKPGILPLPGSNTEMAITLAGDLVKAAGLPEAAILLITDNINENAANKIKDVLPDSASLTILGVGTESGAPIPNDGDFLKDRNGSTIIAKRNSDVMKKIASDNNGDYLPMQADTRDIDFFYQKLEAQFSQSNQSDEQQRRYDRWYEFAPTLLLLLAPLLALAFRRGIIMLFASVSIGILSLTPNYAHASWWDSLWKNQDQRGAELYQQQEYDSAVKKLHDPQWKGSAYYKNSDYEAALKSFSEDKSAIGDYNRGNALAKLQRFDEAISAYDDALKKDKDFEAAKKNKAIIEELQRQQEQNKQQSQGQENPSEQGNQSNSQDQNSQDQNEQNKQQNSAEDQSQQGNTNNQQSQETNKDTEPTQQENSKNDEDSQQQSSQQQKEQSGENSDNESTLAENSYQQLSKEEQQALQQWLRKVPDDPSGLLKRKFEYEYRKRRQQYQQGEWQLPENNAHQRY